MNYIKMSPLTGMVGYGGGGTGLSLSGISEIIWYGGRALAMGSWRMGSEEMRYYGEISYKQISTSANGIDFGDLTTTRGGGAGLSDASRGVDAGGRDSAGNTRENIISYVTISTTGNSTDFGDTQRGTNMPAGASDATRGIIAGGDRGQEEYWEQTGYITIQSPGNATDFGDLDAVSNNKGRMGIAGYNDATRACFSHGMDRDENLHQQIQYFTIQTTGNSTNFGDAGENRRMVSGASDQTRGLMFGGNTSSGYEGSVNARTGIDYVTIQTTANATGFGSLAERVAGTAASSDGIYGLTMGGWYNDEESTNYIQRVTIQTTGNATDLCDLNITSARGAGCSGD